MHTLQFVLFHIATHNSTQAQHSCIINIMMEYELFVLR